MPNNIFFVLPSPCPYSSIYYLNLLRHFQQSFHVVPHTFSKKPAVQFRPSLEIIDQVGFAFMST